MYVGQVCFMHWPRKVFQKAKDAYEDNPVAKKRARWAEATKRYRQKKKAKEAAAKKVKKEMEAAMEAAQSQRKLQQA